MLRTRKRKRRRYVGVKLNESKVRTIRKLRRRGWLHREIAERYDISASHSSNVCVHRFWKEC